MKCGGAGAEVEPFRGEPGTFEGRNANINVWERSSQEGSQTLVGFYYDER
jgi:hypothetical protein